MALRDSCVARRWRDGAASFISWHIRRPLDLDHTLLPAQFQIGDFAYEITPGAGGAWRMTANAFLSSAFNTPTDQGRLLGKVDLNGMNIDRSYDPARLAPFASRSIFRDTGRNVFLEHEVGVGVPVGGSGTGGSGVFPVLRDGSERAGIHEISLR